MIWTRFVTTLSYLTREAFEHLRINEAMIDIPGKEVEKELSKGLIPHFLRMFAAKKEAAAMPLEANTLAARKLIEAENELKIERYRNDQRREEDIKEVIHQENLRIIAEKARAAADMIQRKFSDQNSSNIIDVMKLSIDFRDKIIDEPERDLAEDWLLRFLSYAASVDDAQLREVLAKALADSLSLERPMISFKAIDTIRFMDEEIRNSFDFVMRNLAISGRVPECYFETRFAGTPADLNVTLLIEAGLIKITRTKNISFFVGNFRFVCSISANSSHYLAVLEFTKIGKEISGIIEPLVRKRFDNLGFDVDVKGINGCQSRFGLSLNDVARHARALVQDVSDIGGLTFSVKYHKIFEEKVSVVSISDSIRGRVEDPIGLRLPNLTEYDISAEDISLAAAYIAEIVDFDENQLPYMTFDTYDSSVLNQADGGQGK